MAKGRCYNVCHICIRQTQIQLDLGLLMQYQEHEACRLKGPPPQVTSIKSNKQIKLYKKPKPREHYIVLTREKFSVKAEIVSSPSLQKGYRYQMILHVTYATILKHALVKVEFQPYL